MRKEEATRTESEIAPVREEKQQRQKKQLKKYL
jgi:hypothetical protein